MEMDSNGEMSFKFVQIVHLFYLIQILGQQQGNKTLVFVGEKKSGKSSLIAKFLDQPVKDEMPETAALQFKYGEKVREDRKVKVNVYEQGGGRVLSNLLQAALNPQSIS